MVIGEPKRERGKTGARRKPLEQKILEGDRAKRGTEGRAKTLKAFMREHKLSAANRKGVPPAPEVLNPIGREKWVQLFTELQLYLKMIDLDALEVYCQAWQDYQLLTAEIKIEGFTTIGATGGTIKNPKVNARTDAIARIKEFGSRLGLDPSSRQKILEGLLDAEEDAASDPWAFMDE